MSKNNPTHVDILEAYTKTGVSLIALVVCFLIIFDAFTFGNSESVKTWAAGIIGLIVGYWLK